LLSIEPFAYTSCIHGVCIRNVYKALHTSLAYGDTMVLQGETKIYTSGGRHSIYIPSGLVNDSAFPFAVGETLTIRIENDRIIVEKTKKSKKD
jgi:hypothetical protein